MTQKEAVSLLTFLASHSSVISEEMYFTIINEKYSDIITKLAEINVEFENMGDTTIRLKIDYSKELDIELFCSTDSFYRKYKETTSLLLILGNKDNDTLISVINNNYIIFQQIQKGMTDNVTTNYLYLKKIISLLLKSRAIDYYDTANNRFFFLSPECGKLEIHEDDISNLVCISKLNINLYDTYVKFNSMFEYQKGWEYILKNKIIRGLEDFDIEKEGFKELILNLSKFISVTEKDYEIFLTSRKHESIIQQFENEKYIFAEKIRSILQKISSSIISIPLAFFSVSFAMKEINELWQLNIIVISLFIYTIFSLIVNYLFLGDLDILKEEMKVKKDNISMGMLHLEASLKKIIKPYFRRITFLKVLVFLSMILFALIFLFFVFLYTNNNRQMVNI